MTLSPFDPLSAVATTPLEPELSVDALERLDSLVYQALAAKTESERHKAVYDSLREQLCATLRDLGTTKFEGAYGKVRLKQTRSGWTYSDVTEALAIQLKAQQQIEKKNGTAVPSQTTFSADVFGL